jgi:hypothetical protein
MRIEPRFLDYQAHSPVRLNYLVMCFLYCIWEGIFMGVVQISR